MKLHLGDYFSFFLKGSSRVLEIPLSAPRRLDHVLTDQGIPLGEIALLVVNGELVELENAIVADVDEVKLFPPMDGG